MNWRTLIAGSLIPLVLGGCATAVATGAAQPGRRAEPDRSTEQRYADQRITAAINRLFVRDNHLPAMAIRVETWYGRVTLTGEVPDRLTADRAVSVAGSVPGVHAVLDRLTITLNP